jgi:hypothetical protein
MRDYFFLRFRDVVANIALRLLARLILVYIWNVDMLIDFQNVDERNLFLVMLVRMARWMIRALERRNNDHAQPRAAPVITRRRHAVDLLRAAGAVGAGAPRRRDLAGLDLNNILPRRLRGRNGGRP